MVVEHDPAENLNKILYFIEQAAKKDVRLLVFPECALQGWLWSWNWEKWMSHEDKEQTNYFEEVAEEIPGKSTSTIAEYSSRNGIVIQVGMAEKVPTNDRFYIFNSVALMDPTGTIQVHRKVHTGRKQVVFERGASFNVCDTSLGKIGPLICADVVHPEAARVLALGGANAITLSNAWGVDPHNEYMGYRYDLLTRANSLMNSLWLISSDQTGSSRRAPNSSCYGHSRIIDPKGNVIAEIGKEEGLVTANIDLETPVTYERMRWATRSPEAYTAITSSEAQKEMDRNYPAF